MSRGAAAGKVLKQGSTSKGQGSPRQPETAPAKGSSASVGPDLPALPHGDLLSSSACSTARKPHPREGNPRLNELIFPNSFPSQTQTCHEITVPKLQEAAVPSPGDGRAITHDGSVMPTPGLRQGQVSCTEKPISRLFFLTLHLPGCHFAKTGPCQTRSGAPRPSSLAVGDTRCCSSPAAHKQQLHPAVCQAEEAAQRGQTHQAVPKWSLNDTHSSGSRSTMGQEETPGVPGELLRSATSLQGHGSLGKSCVCWWDVTRTGRMGVLGSVGI